jgi:signal transduction histidine kinase
MGAQLEVLGPLLARHGAEVLTPMFQLGELIIKFKNMKISIERINSIVRAMKAYSHIDRAELQEVSIHEGLDDTLTIMNYIFRGNVEVEKRYMAELPSSQGHPGELNQVWTNLLQNAYDAMEGGKGRIVVETGTEVIHDRTYIAVRITDNGKGIPKEILPHIFDSFFTTKEKGKGSGLGLDICKRIIEKHQGSLEVSTAPGATTFTVLLPVERRRDEPGTGPTPLMSP